ncbi:MAG: oxidoreductase [Bellilinea sp.]|nr:MAG: oxidoreductase [Bellilinea sp.]
MKPVRAILIGAGQRGAEAYAPYALKHPNELKFIAVAEPDEERRRKFANVHAIPEKYCFTTWEEIMEQPQLAEAAIITTQDWLHTRPAIAAMERGYHVLLEKPMATSLEECQQLIEVSERNQRQLHICHVLRYTQHARKMREIVQSGVLGEIIDVDHRENVSFWHMAHSYVRGNWRNRHQSSPMILAKCCHDLDILPWILGQKPILLSSCGELTHFRSDKAPINTPERCVDGCPIERECPYSAIHIYIEMQPFWHSYRETCTNFFNKAILDAWLKNPALIRNFSRIFPFLRQITDYKGWPLTVLTQDPSPDKIREALRNGPYGRCVYHCDNNVVDHQVVSMQFQKGTTVTLTMHGHSHVEHRSTRIEGTRGRLMGVLGNGGGWITVEEHRSRKKLCVDTSPPTGEGHGGGDSQLMAEFVAQVRAGGYSDAIKEAAREALFSHYLAFTAEQARIEKKVITINPEEIYSQ